MIEINFFNVRTTVGSFCENVLKIKFSAGRKRAEILKILNRIPDNSAGKIGANLKKSRDKEC